MHSREETFKNIYTLASAIYKLSPWKWMDESDIFGVKIPGTERIYYISVMGSEEEFYAISAYQGTRALGQFWQFQEKGDTLAPETFFTIPQIMLSFTDRENLRPDHLASVKSTGIHFHGKGCWPLLEKIIPAYLPVLPEGNSLSDTIIILEQTLDIVFRAEDDPDLLYPQESDEDVFLIRERNAKDSTASWEDSYQKADAEKGKVNYKLIYQKESVQSIALLPESQMVIQLDLIMLPTPVKEKGQKAYFPFALIMVDYETGLVIGMDTLIPVPDLDTMYENLPQRVLDEIFKLGFRPKRIEVRAALLEGLIRYPLKMSNVRLLSVKTMEALENAVQSLFSNLES